MYVLYVCYFFVMIRRPPSATRTDTLFPYTTLFRSPTAFATYAVDGDGDGRRDLWDSKADVFASTANYLAPSGWKPGLAWGAEVRLPPGFDYGLAELSVRKPVGAWREMGVAPVGVVPIGGLPPDDAEASILSPAGHRGPAFLSPGNFRVILRYNNAK